MATGDAELRIANSMLTTISETTQSTLETTHPSMIQMRAIIEREDFDFQSRGWWFNREKNVTLVPDFNGRVTVPETALSFSIGSEILSALTSVEKSRYTRRGQYVYDSILHKNTIFKSIVADLVVRLDIDDMPPLAQTYLGKLCKEQANLGDDGDMSKQTVLKEERQTAWGNLYAKELSTLAVNALQSPQAQSLQYRGGSGGTNPNLIGG